jgi:biotin synthase
MRSQKTSQLLKMSIRALSKPQVIARKYGTVQNGPSITATTPQSSVFENAIAADSPRNTWTKEEITQIYEMPLMKLSFAAVSLVPSPNPPVMDKRLTESSGYRPP